MSDTIYSYYKVSVKNRYKTKRNDAGIICIRADRPKMTNNDHDSSYIYDVAFAFCSPKDRFNKRIAHKITGSRINNNRIKQKVQIFSSFRLNAKQLFDVALRNAKEHKNLIKTPGWVLTAHEIKPLRKKTQKTFNKKIENEIRILS